MAVVWWQTVRLCASEITHRHQCVFLIQGCFRSVMLEEKRKVTETRHLRQIASFLSYHSYETFGANAFLFRNSRFYREKNKHLQMTELEAEKTD